jgi:DNA polymerase-3 subunit delta
MPRQSFNDFYKAIRKGEIPRAIYLFGEEDVLKDEALKEIESQVVDPGLRDFNYDQRSAGQLDPDAVESLCHTLPMMADRRLVVIREVEAWNKRARAKTAVLHYLEKPAPETVVVLIQGSAEPDEDADLARATVSVEVARLPASRAEKWLVTRAAERGLTLEPAAIIHLVRAVDGNLAAARTELDKLAGLGGEAPITVEQVSALLGVRHGETPADWCDAVLADETGHAAAMLPHVLDRAGVSGVGLLIQLGPQLLGLGLARAHFDRGLRGGALAGAVFQGLLRARPGRLDYRASAERWSRLADRWPLPRVRAALAGALAADRRLKSTTLADERGVLVDLIMQLAHRAREAA